MTEHISFESLLHSSECPPLVFHNTISNWLAAMWTPEFLADVMKAKKFNCKIAPRNSRDLLPETECFHLDVTIADYVDWSIGKVGADNPLSALDPSKYSCYVDYKYMVDFFSECPHLLKQVSWNCFGLHERDGTDSTIWIGSSGAYTPMHYDTYGFNLVAQIYGRKRWFLYPSDQTPYMYPTRIPYEESSVFCQVNILDPDLKQHPKFKMTTPYIVTLEPGQVLYVPRHWWHFVECIDSAISINTWVPVLEDQNEHVKEAVARIIACHLFPLVTDIQKSSSVINTNEELTNPEVNFAFLQKSVQELMSRKASDNNKMESTSGSECEWLHSSDLFLKFIEAFRGHTVKVVHRDSHVRQVDGKKRKNICDYGNTTQQDCFVADSVNNKTAIQNIILDTDIISEETLKKTLSEVSESTLKVGDYHCCLEGEGETVIADDHEISSRRDISRGHESSTQHEEFKRDGVVEDRDINHASSYRYFFRDIDKKMHIEEMSTKEELIQETKIKCAKPSKPVEIKTVPSYSFTDYVRFLQENYQLAELERGKAKESMRNTQIYESICKIAPVDLIDSILNPSCIETICNVLKDRLNIA